MKPQDFYTRDRANQGVEVALYLPSGEKSEHSLRIRGIDSDAYRAAAAEMRRRMIEAVTEEKKELAPKDIENERLDLLASLVASWTFEESCTSENVKALLVNAPQIAQEIDKLSARRSLFFGTSLKTSSNSPAPTSSSTSSQKDQPPQSAGTLKSSGNKRARNQKP